MIGGVLARGLVRWRWLVIAVWLVLGAIAFSQAPKTPGKLALRGGTDKLTEARLADRLLSERFSRPFGEFFAVTVEAPSSLVTGAAREALDSLTGAASRFPGVQSVVSYLTRGDSLFISPDERTSFFLVSFAVAGDSVGNLVTPFRAELQRALSQVPNRPGYRIHVTGRSALDLDVRNVSAQDASRFELRLLPVSLVILVLAFGALVAALLPLAIGVLAIAVSLTAVGLLASYTPMSVFVLNLTTMIGLGVGIDYSLLMVTRFREELARGYRRREAAERTVLTAGVAVFNSGLTVVVGFGALLLTPMVETRSVGIGGLIVVGVAVLLCITLLPALLAALGRAIDRPKWLARRLTWYHAPQ
ncbi:MAG: MMPL family transporter, partial [Gemmatimonadales bacterium]